MGGTGLPALRPGDLLAVAAPPSETWLEAIRRAWDAGAAVLPVDHRLPPPAARSLLECAKPTVILDADGLARNDGGVPTADGVGLVVATSGTSGAPKLVELNRGAIGAAVSASASVLGARPRDRWLSCLPLAHVGGALVLLRAVVLGAPVSVQPRFDVTSFAAEHDAAFTSVVPTMLLRLLDAGVDLSRYRAILVGGAHLPAPARRRADQTGARVVETYGLTESCGGVVYEGQPLPGTRMRLAEDGRIELRGPTTMLGYRLDPDATSSAFTDDGWLSSGDVGEIDAAGRLRVLGRLDDLIVTGGEKVWPDEVEAVLRSHPKVHEAGVRGRPDEEWGARVVAWIVPRSPGDPPTLAELRDHVAGSLPRFKAPAEVVLVEELPRTLGGKLRRTALGSGTE